jgi:hypothetical protein
MASMNSLKWWVSHPVYPVLCALLHLIVYILGGNPPPCPHDCSYYNTAPSCSISNFLCLRNGQLYGKPLGTDFIDMYGLI